MPDPATTAAAITAVSSIANMGLQGSMNQATRKWNEIMYNTQRADALADWMRQNEYNHPQAQMARLQAAGLNPNLVYGKGADAISNQSIRGTDIKSWNPQAPQIDGGGIVRSALVGMDLKAKDAQTRNTEQVIANNQAKEEETKARTLNILGNTKKTNLQNSRYNELVDSQLSLMNERTRQTQAQTDQTLTRTEQLKMIFSPTLEKAVNDVLQGRLNQAKTRQEVNLLKQQIINVSKDAEIKQLDIDLKKLGIQPGDNMFMRMGARILNQFMEPAKDQTWQKDWNKPRNLMNR